MSKEAAEEKMNKDRNGNLWLHSYLKKTKKQLKCEIGKRTYQKNETVQKWSQKVQKTKVEDQKVYKVTWRQIKVNNS